VTPSPARRLLLLVTLGCLLVPACGRSEPPEIPLTFDHYHGYDETRSLLEAMAMAYPSLARVSSIGQDLRGFDLWAIEITNTATGAADAKPAFYADGNIDADEPSSTEAILHLAHRLLTRHGSDPAITRLVDTTTFYLVPICNPFMANLYVTTPMTGIVSSINARPRDDDGDGRMDEDPPDDVNGDGKILQMRVRDAGGEWIASPLDPRLMVRRAPDEPGRWRVLSEGFDNDGDGQFNEDWIGGVDLNRNFPFDWKPEWIQEGAGAYPLSEPETRAIVDFVNAHPNIGFVISGHSGPDVGLIYRPYGSRPDTAIPAVDADRIAAFATTFSQLSGGLRFEAPYGAQAERRFGRPIYGYGFEMEWAYEMAGAYAFTPEHGMIPGTPGPDGRIPEIELLRVSDAEFGGSLFVPWTPFQHPTLGDVEIGGFVKFTRPNPPPGPYLERLVDVYARMYEYWASTLPRLEVFDATARAAAGGYLITAGVGNAGLLPTNVTQRSLEYGTAPPVVVSLEPGPGVELIEGERRQTIGQLEGVGLRTPAAAPIQHTFSWRVTKTGDAEAWVEVVASSAKAGTARVRVPLQ